MLTKFPPAYSKQADALLDYTRKGLYNYLLRVVSAAESMPHRKHIKTPEQVLLVGLKGYVRELKKRTKRRLDAEWAVVDLLDELGFNSEGGTHV